MCGIAGICAVRGGLPAPEIGTATAMAAALAHRGPDEFGVYRDEQVALAHARLSIVDVSTGQQPLANEDGSLWIVLNGEIFNHFELRAELEALGHSFRTRSDTEVVVHAFEAWGDRCFERLNGQFAVALWDARRRALVLARDGLGICPLYTCEHAGRLYFASEVKALFAATPAIPRALDPAGLAETFTFWTVVPPQSVFQGVTELRPGHVRTVTRDDVRERCFWAPAYPTSAAEGFHGSLDDAVAEVRIALETAVRLRLLRADVPVGSYLSGGLDSSLVAALARRVHGGRLATFSLRFEDAEYDETEHQRTLAARIESVHHELLVRRADIGAVFPEVVAHAERPLLRSAPAPLFLLSRLVRESGMKAVLTGEGADEMFAGYDLFREAKVRRFWARHPTSDLRPRLLERLYPWVVRSPVARAAMARQFFGAGHEDASAPGFAHSLRWRSGASLLRLLAPGLRDEVRSHRPAERLLASLPDAFGAWSPLSQDQYLETRTLLSGYLLSAQGDRMLLAHSVEGRFPFLDPDLIALANALPPAYKLRVLDEKHVLKRVGASLLPRSIVRRSKQPYRAPDAAAFVGSTAPEWVRDLVTPRAIAAAGLFDPGAVGQLWRKCEAHPPSEPFSNADNMAVVGVVSTQLLHDGFIQTRPAVPRGVRLRTLVDRLQRRECA